MKTKRKFVAVAIAIIAVITLFAVQVDTQKEITPVAFPGAEGFGANTIGGRGGTVYIVTNTNDSGAGSLRECVAASGPRTCAFEVGGMIVLNSVLSITNPYLTIAGQTAPGGGITLKSNGSDIFAPRTHDIIIRYVTGRPGVGGENHASQSAVNNSISIYNIIFDHCSFSWGIDSVWETWYRVYDLTIQWSFVNEGLDCSTHSKGCHSKGLMIGGPKLGESNTAKGSYNVSVIRNLMAHDAERAPLMQLCGDAQVINNVTYNPMWTFSHQEIICADPSAVSTINWIGNYHKQGPDSTSTRDLKVSVTGGSSKGYAYVTDNLSRRRGGTTDVAWIVEANGLTVTTPADAPFVTTTGAVTAYNQVLAEGGNSKGLNCNGNWYFRRDSIDARVVNEVINGTGHIIDNPSEVGGWIVPASGIACGDTDRDGIPDTWETSHGLNPNLKSDGNSVAPSGYTWLEEYINGTGGVVPAPSSTPTATQKVTVSATVTRTPTFTPTRTPTWTPTFTPSLTRTPSATWTFTPTFTLTPTPTFTATPTLTPTFTMTMTMTPSPTLTFTPTVPPTVVSKECITIWFPIHTQTVEICLP